MHIFRYPEINIRSDWEVRWKEEKHGCYDGEGQADQICRWPPYRTKIESPRRGAGNIEYFTATKEEEDDRGGVRDVQTHNTWAEDSIERGRAAEELSNDMDSYVLEVLSELKYSRCNQISRLE